MVKFQHLESALRGLVSAMGLSGPVRELPKLHSREVSSLKKKALGDLTSRFYARMAEGDRSNEPSTEQEQQELVISTRYQLDPTLLAEIKRELLSLVQERNRLIHRDLVLVDFNSIEACETLSQRLDEQNSRINTQLEFLKTLREAHLAALAELAEFVASDEFITQLDRHDGDA